MNISVKRTGGFAGITEERTINTAQLDAATTQQLRQMVQRINFFNLPVTVSGGGVGADLFHYEITIVEGKQRHTVAFDDDGSPETTPLRQFAESILQME
ncbi:MAG: hypothetical protein HYR94_12970 [Chloroflexi bacterium]|nr:hypothetical protein [Chloroflexota bacterium]